MDFVGKTLGQYEIVSEIGAGGMATVYRGNQAALNRQVAVKVLAGELARDPSFRERFSREARAVAQLAHPNILPVYDFGQDAQTGALYFAMQLVDGGTLTQRMGQPMEVAAAVRITAQIARALDYAHKRGLIHRDVKPANVLLSQDGHPLLADFGIARMMEDTHLTQTGASLGTPAYMSPEQAQGEPIDQRTDIYALGVVTYEMLTGQLPFQADTPVGLLHQHAYAAPPALRSLRPDLPQALESVVMRALAKDPAQRYASAAEFADALEASLSSRWRLRLPWPQRTARPARPTRELATARVAPPTPPSQPAMPASAPRPATPAGQVGRWLSGGVKWLLRTALTIVAVLLVIVFALLVVSLLALGMLTEQTITHQDWKLDQLTPGTTYTYKRVDFERGLRVAITPYTLDALTDMRVTFEPPDEIVFSGTLGGQAISLQVRFRDIDGLPNVQIERFNDVPLYVIGGLLSDRVNNGFKQVWEKAPVRIDTLTMSPDYLTAIYRRR